MNDYLTHLAIRALERADPVQPRLASRFEPSLPGSTAAALPEWENHSEPFVPAATPVTPADYSPDTAAVAPNSRPSAASLPPAHTVLPVPQQPREAPPVAARPVVPVTFPLATRQEPGAVQFRRELSPATETPTAVSPPTAYPASASPTPSPPTVDPASASSTPLPPSAVEPAAVAPNSRPSAASLPPAHTVLPAPEQPWEAPPVAAQPVVPVTFPLATRQEPGAVQFRQELSPTTEPLTTVSPPTAYPASVNPTPLPPSAVEPAAVAPNSRPSAASLPPARPMSPVSEQPREASLEAAQPVVALDSQPETWRTSTTVQSGRKPSPSLRTEPPGAAAPPAAYPATADPTLLPSAIPEHDHADEQAVRVKARQVEDLLAAENSQPPTFPRPEPGPGIVAQPRVGLPAGPPLRAESPKPPETSPTVRITIGRVEVRAVIPASAPLRPPPAPPRPQLSLDEYLQQRKGERR